MGRREEKGGRNPSGLDQRYTHKISLKRVLGKFHPAIPSDLHLPISEAAFNPMKATHILMIPVSILMASCAQTSNTSDTYQRGQAGQVESLQTGRVISIDQVKLEGGTEAGTMIGALAGGLLGSQLGKGRTAGIAGATGGALAGGAAGSHIGQAMGSKPGLRIGIKLDGGGGTFTVVQEVNPRKTFYVGDRVRILGSGNSAKVTH